MTDQTGSLNALLQHPWPEQNDFGRGYNHLRDLMLDVIAQSQSSEIWLDMDAAKEAWRLGNPSSYELSWPAFLAMIENYEASRTIQPLFSKCIDEGCPHYGKAIKCEPKDGGCIATIPQSQPNEIPDELALLIGPMPKVTQRHINDWCGYDVEKATEPVSSNFTMEEAKAVIDSTGKEESGTSPEAAGLEPECDRPSSATQQLDDAALLQLSNERFSSGDFLGHEESERFIQETLAKTDQPVGLFVDPDDSNIDEAALDKAMAFWEREQFLHLDHQRLGWMIAIYQDAKQPKRESDNSKKEQP